MFLFSWQLVPNGLTVLYHRIQQNIRKLERWKAPVWNDILCKNLLVGNPSLIRVRARNSGQQKKRTASFGCVLDSVPSNCTMFSFVSLISMRCPTNVCSCLHRFSKLCWVLRSRTIYQSLGHELFCKLIHRRAVSSVSSRIGNTSVIGVVLSMISVISTRPLRAVR